MLAELDRLGTIAAVADELHLTASGVSMQLTALEREVGLDLTERRGRRLALTPAGRVLVEHARTILERMALADIEAAALRSGAAGAYRVAAFPSAARTIVADTWAALTEQAGGLELSLDVLEPEAALDALATGGADIAVVHSYSNVARRIADELTVRPLVDEPV